MQLSEFYFNKSIRLLNIAIGKRYANKCSWQPADMFYLRGIFNLILSVVAIPIDMMLSTIKNYIKKYVFKPMSQGEMYGLINTLRITLIEEKSQYQDATKSASNVQYFRKAGSRA